MESGEARKKSSRRVKNELSTRPRVAPEKPDPFTGQGGFMLRGTEGCIMDWRKYIKQNQRFLYEDFVKDCTDEESSFIQTLISSTPSDQYISLESIRRENTNLFKENLSTGASALIYYENLFRAEKNGDLDSMILFVAVAESLAASFNGQRFSAAVMSSVDRILKSEKENFASQGTKKAADSRWLELNRWKERIKSVATCLWQEGSNMTHVQMADYLVEEYEEDGSHPFSRSIPGIKDGNERAFVIEQTKMAAKEMGRGDLVKGHLGK